MAKQKRLLNSFEITRGKGTHVDIELYYHIGGMNYFTGTSESRGLYISVQPCEKRVFEGGGMSVGFTAFTGVKKHVKDMTRFTQKALDTFVVDADLKRQLLDHILAKNDIEIKGHKFGDVME